MVGLTENADALKKWMLAGPEIADLLDRLERGLFGTGKINDCHRSVTESSRKRFEKDVKSLKITMLDFGNPFMDESVDLYNISNKHVVAENVKASVMAIQEKGVEMYQTFVEQRLKTNATDLMAALKDNKFHLFSSKEPTNKHSKTKLSGLKSDCSPFSRLYIASCSNREGDLEKFFSHENSVHPPARSVGY